MNIFAKVRERQERESESWYKWIFYGYDKSSSIFHAINKNNKQ